MSDLTERQQIVLDIITRHVKPVCIASLRELAAELGFAHPTGILSHLAALEKKDRIRRRKGKIGIEVVPQEVPNGDA